MARTNEIVKSVTLKGRAQTSAIPRSLKGISDAAGRAGTSAGKAGGKFQALGKDLDQVDQQAGPQEMPQMVRAELQLEAVLGLQLRRLHDAGIVDESVDPAVPGTQLIGG